MQGLAGDVIKVHVTAAAIHHAELTTNDTVLAPQLRLSCGLFSSLGLIHSAPCTPYRPRTPITNRDNKMRPETRSQISWHATTTVMANISVVICPRPTVNHEFNVVVLRPRLLLTPPATAILVTAPKGAHVSRIAANHSARQLIAQR